MSFAENLQYLRRKEKITQEELAEELNVSRQSVSKWETGEAYPETEKIILLCDKFNVTMDDLLRGDVRGADAEICEGRTQDKTALKAEFVAHMDKFSKRIAIAITLIILGAALIVVFSGSKKGLPLSLAIVGYVVAALCMCFSIFMFIVSGISHDDFQRRVPKMENLFDGEEKKAFDKKFATVMALLISVLVLDAIALALTYTFGKDKIDGFIENIVIGSFLFIASFIIGGICYMGIQHQKFDVAEYNKEISRKVRAGRINKLTDAICGAIMLTATGIYLLIGVIGNLWHPGWIIFPVGGIICAIITTIQKFTEKDKEEKNDEDD